MSKSTDQPSTCRDVDSPSHSLVRCTRWFLPLLLLPLPTAPPYFLMLFLLTLALHARPCFYCIILLAALFLSSCYWQSFPLDAHLSVPWADNITTFSEALSAAMPPHLDTLYSTPPIVRVADRCWCDFASGPFEPYDVQKWERDSIQKAVAHIERQWKQSLEPDSVPSANATIPAEPTHLELQRPSTTPNVSRIRNETLSSIFRSLFSIRSKKSEPHPLSTPTVDTTTPPPETPTEPSAVEPSIPAEPLLAPGQLDMRPFGFELIFDFRWSRRS
ncbi:hypothetical protein OG21DRAFT_1482271 [Imleria badia]|nr:hypothetical protein OG21DRAFT_1482271 [Imleria badia]